MPKHERALSRADEHLVFSSTQYVVKNLVTRGQIPPKPSKNASICCEVRQLTESNISAFWD
ncbi:MAG: hypothetical protein UU98_C0044G0010 [Parcubacteria group bacterium GW2011_GWD2_42_14]|nr:MAG: hypothetical protein UU98_C0044G0010 [Parcubacteria group bacterium GW2011_GWD2_42_14]